MEHLVSIIIPTYRRSNLLGRAIDSVLNQTYKNIEVIVVDDNSAYDEYRKKNEEFMKKYECIYNVKYIKHNENKNGSVARNTGIKYASGEYIGFLDDDDEFHTEKIKTQVDYINKLDSSYGAVYCGFNIIRGNKLISSNKPYKEGILSKELLTMSWGTGSGSNVLFKKNVLEEINGFDENLKRHQDWDVLLRMFRNYKIGVINEPLLNIYKDSRINIPNVELFVDVKKYFFNKFKTDIEKIDIKYRNLIYQRHSLEICISFIKNKKYKKAYKSLKVANNYFKLRLKDKISLILVIIYTYLPFKERLLVLFSGIIDRFRIVKD